MPTTPTSLDDLVRDVEESAVAYIRGDVRRYLGLVAPDDEFVLMPPYGGDAILDRDYSDEAIAITEEYFAGPGDAKLEVVQAHASGDLAFLAAVERQHGVVGGQPEQDLSLRVTLVFRWDGTRWRLLHRHADPLVRSISWERLMELLRGED